MSKQKNPTIESVEFIYTGEKDSFLEFLKTVVKEYITTDRVCPEEPESEKKIAS